jgi:hypothetical protein
VTPRCRSGPAAASCADAIGREEATTRIREGELDGYGEPSPALAEALETMGTRFNRFSYFQGLEVEVLDEAPA